MLRIRVPILAQTATVNAANLQLKLLEKTTSSQATCDTSLSLLMAAKSFKEMKLQKISSAPTYYDLPTPSASLLGQIYYVNNERTFYTVENEVGFFIWRKLTGTSSSIFSWGKNTSGQLGNATVANISSPGTISGPNSTWTSVTTAGCNHGAGIKSDGTLWTWGFNTNGQIGNNSTADRSSPGTTVGCGTNWCHIATGNGSATAAIKTDGTLWMWGQGTCGALGNNLTTNRSSPVTVSGGGTTWCFASTADLVSASIKTDGTLWTWGRNNYGQLGSNTTANRSSPVTVSGGGTNWCTLSMGAASAAIKQDGTLWVWGKNSYGSLGNNSTTYASSPVTTIGCGTTWCQVDSSGRSMAAIKTDGTLWTWGRNYCGELGDNSTTARSSPGTTSGGGTTWCNATTGYLSFGAVKTDGTLWTWGQNYCGILGNNSSSNRSSPGTTTGCGNLWCSISFAQGWALAVARVC